MTWILRFAGLALGLLALAACNPTAAETFVVNTTADTSDAAINGVCADANGHCSLRAAIEEANANPNVTAIDLTGGQTYTLSSGVLPIAHPAYITASDGQATIDANNTSPVFDITSAGGVHRLTNLNITGGTSSRGAVRIEGGATTEVQIDETRVHHNNADGIHVASGTLKLSNSTIDNNQFIGFVSSGGISDIYQATITNNSIVFSDLQMLLEGTPTVTMDASTITSANTGMKVNGSSTLAISNSVIDTTGVNCTVANGITSAGNNVTTDSTCGLAGANDDQSAERVVKPLADNGGPVPTQMPDPNDGAHNTRTCGPADSFDARGQLRAANGGCDKGAVESRPGELTGDDCIPPHTATSMVPEGNYDRCDLSGLDLTDADLTFAVLNVANLSGTNLTRALLVNAALSFADASGANFTNANLSEAVLIQSNFSNADFTGAFLFGANVQASTFTGAIWNGTVCVDGTLSDDNGGTCEGHLS